VKRLGIALIAYVALAILTWSTIDDQRIRVATVAILLLFAANTWLRRKDVTHPDGESETR
jgi:hypothetical protein